MYRYTPLTAEHPVLWTPPSQEKLAKKAIQLRIAPPTPLHEDQLNMHLSVLGLTRVSDADIRATIINELFDIYEKDGKTVDVAEADANFLDSVWTKSAVYQEMCSDWAVSDRQRRIDIAAGVPEEKIPYVPMPDALISARDNARHKTLIREITDRSVKVRMTVAESQQIGQKSNDLMVKMHVLPAADNFEFEDGRNDLGILSDNDIARIKQAMTVPDYEDLIKTIDSLYSFGKEEEGNSDSQSGKESDQNGSAGPSDDSENSSGNSTS